MRLKKIIIISAICFLLLAGMPVLAATPTIGDISKELICQCGCTLTIANCTHIECGSRGAMTTVIKDKLTQGQSEDEVIQLLVSQYGESVLASPLKEGFNLLAWFLPFTGILVGIGIIHITIKKWVKKGKQSQINTETVSEESEDVYQKRLEQELKEFTEVGFR